MLISITALLAPAVLLAAPAPLPKATYTYKEAGALRLELDVYRAGDTVVRPVLVWIHGGALIMGSRAGPPGDLLELCRAGGFALASLDYRLAPQVKLPEIIEDIKDGFRWIRGKGAGLAYLDPRKVVVAGGSAGGYLTLMTGICVDPRPVALVAYWGYGDVDGEWYARPSEFYRRSKPLCDPDQVKKALAPEVVAAPADKAQGEARQLYYLYLRQNGLWTREVTGFEPEKQKAKLDPYCPVRNVSAAYPPTLLIHGTEDTDVPYGLSAAMAKELERSGVQHELVTVPGAGHGLSGGDKSAVLEAHRKALEFIRRHLK
jgi:acetyl esterase/lipase